MLDASSMSSLAGSTRSRSSRGSAFGGTAAGGATEAWPAAAARARSGKGGATRPEPRREFRERGWAQGPLGLEPFPRVTQCVGGREQQLEVRLPQQAGAVARLHQEAFEIVADLLDQRDVGGVGGALERVRHPEERLERGGIGGRRLERQQVPIHQPHLVAQLGGERRPQAGGEPVRVHR